MPHKRPLLLLLLRCSSSRRRRKNRRLELLVQGVEHDQRWRRGAATTLRACESRGLVCHILADKGSVASTKHASNLLVVVGGVHTVVAVVAAVAAAAAATL